MSKKIIDEKLLAQLIDKFEKYDKKDKLKAYITDTVTTCEKLCLGGLNIRVLNEFKFMVENLAKELGI